MIIIRYCSAWYRDRQYRLLTEYVWKKLNVSSIQSKAKTFYIHLLCNTRSNFGIFRKKLVASLHWMLTLRNFPSSSPTSAPRPLRPDSLKNDQFGRRWLFAKNVGCLIFDMSPFSGKYTSIPCPRFSRSYEYSHVSTDTVFRTWCILFCRLLVSLVVHG